MSFPEPTSLPLGIPLTNFALEQTCGTVVASRFLQVWRNVNKVAATHDNPFPLGPAPRLESILGDISEVEVQTPDCRFEFMNGFRSFLRAPFNDNHLCLAELLRQGANIVTTNFDTCIEDAYRSLCGGSDQLVPTENLLTSLRAQHSCSAGRLWHAHGIAEDTTTLGATIRAVKEGLPLELKNWLDGLLGKDVIFIFIGYSANDSFDITPYFSNIVKSKRGRTAGIFIQHIGQPVPKTADLILERFRQRKKAVVDTTTVLLRLADRHSQIQFTRDFKWKDEFLNNIIDDCGTRLRPYLICKIAFTLGINVEVVSETAYEDALICEQYFDPISFHKTLAYICRVQGRLHLERLHDVKVQQTEADLLGYYYSSGNLRQARKYARPLEQLFRDATLADAELDWSTYTSMSVHCRSVILKYVDEQSQPINREDRCEIEPLLNLTANLSKVTPKNVRFINQIATAMRFHFLLSALLGLDSNEPDQVLALYGDSASVAGFISAHRDMAIRDFFLAKYHGIDKFEEALRHLQISAELAAIVGDKPSMKRARKLRSHLDSWGRHRRSINRALDIS